jgi:predicted nuclease of predicted toxin-antitoxin system
MRVLFDQGTPIALADFLKGHSVRTAKQEGWDALSNGDLLSVAEAAGFHVLVTTDNGVVFQQNLTTRKIAIVVLTRNRWRMVQRMIRKIVAAVNDAKPGSFTEVEIPVR